MFPNPWQFQLKILIGIGGTGESIQWSFPNFGLVQGPITGEDVFPVMAFVFLEREGGCVSRGSISIRKGVFIAFSFLRINFLGTFAFWGANYGNIHKEVVLCAGRG